MGWGEESRWGRYLQRTRLVSGFGLVKSVADVDDARLSISTSDFKRMSHPVLAVEREAQPGDAIRASCLVEGATRLPCGKVSRCNSAAQEMRPSCGFFPAAFLFVANFSHSLSLSVAGEGEAS